jgi:hypothetical protein
MLKVTHQMNDGAGNNVVKFWYSTNLGALWTQLGATISTAGVMSIFDSTSDVWLGDDNAGFNSHSGLVNANSRGVAQGKIYFADRPFVSSPRTRRRTRSIAT